MQLLSRRITSGFFRPICAVLKLLRRIPVEIGIRLVPRAPAFSRKITFFKLGNEFQRFIVVAAVVIRMEPRVNDFQNHPPT